MVCISCDRWFLTLPCSNHWEPEALIKKQPAEGPDNQGVVRCVCWCVHLHLVKERTVWLVNVRTLHHHNCNYSQGEFVCFFLGLQVEGILKLSTVYQFKVDCFCKFSFLPWYLSLSHPTCVVGFVSNIFPGLSKSPSQTFLRRREICFFFENPNLKRCLGVLGHRSLLGNYLEDYLEDAPPLILRGQVITGGESYFSHLSLDLPRLIRDEFAHHGPIN